MSRASYEIVRDDERELRIRDLDGAVSVTNDAEAVVEELAAHLGERILHYYDTMGYLDRLLVKAGKFAGFAPAEKEKGRPLGVGLL